MSEANKAISRRLVEEVFNKGKLEVIEELIAPGYIGYDPAQPEPIKGVEGVKQFVSLYREAFPDLRLTIEKQVAEGDLVATRWSGTGTHKAELMGIAPTGKQATVTGITIDRLADGRIAESWDNWDTLGLLQQLGAVPELARA